MSRFVLCAAMAGLIAATASAQLDKAQFQVSNITTSSTLTEIESTPATKMVGYLRKILVDVNESVANDFRLVLTAKSAYSSKAVTLVDVNVTTNMSITPVYNPRRTAVNTATGVGTITITDDTPVELQFVFVTLGEAAANTANVSLVTTEGGVTTTNLVYNYGSGTFVTAAWNSDGSGYLLKSGDRIRVVNDNTAVVARVTATYRTVGSDGMPDFPLFEDVISMQTGEATGTNMNAKVTVIYERHR